MSTNIKLFSRALPFYRYLKQIITPGYSNNVNELIYIHIGKCGGRSLEDALNRSPIVKKQFTSVRRVHLFKPPILEKSKYSGSSSLDITFWQPFTLASSIYLCDNVSAKNIVLASHSFE